MQKNVIKQGAKEPDKPVTKREMAQSAAVLSGIGSAKVAIGSHDKINAIGQHLKTQKFIRDINVDNIASSIKRGASVDEIREKFADRVYKQRAEINRSVKQIAKHGLILKVASGVAVGSFVAAKYLADVYKPKKPTKVR